MFVDCHQLSYSYRYIHAIDSNLHVIHIEFNSLYHHGMLWTQNRGLCQCIQTGLRFYIKLIRKALLWNKQGLKPIAIVDIDVVYNFMVIDQFIYFASDG